MNIFLELLKANQILKDPKTPGSIASYLLGPQTVSPVPLSPQDQAVNVAKTLGANTLAQMAVDIPNGVTGAIQVSPPVDLVKRMVSGPNFVQAEQTQNGVNALAPIGNVAFPLESVAGGVGNMGLQAALNMLQGKQASDNYGQNFATGIHDTGAIMAALGALNSKAAADTTKYTGDMLKKKYPKLDLETGQKLIRDRRFKSVWE